MKLQIAFCVLVVVKLCCAVPLESEYDAGSGDVVAKRAGKDKKCSPEKELVKDCETKPRENDDTAAIDWFQKCIVTYYCFQKDAKKASWVKQPSFEGELNKEHFKRAAEVARDFFIGKKWKGPGGLVPTWKPEDNCNKLLYITAARYVYVTFLLYEESDGKLEPCKVDPKTKKVIVHEFACYPAPYGSADCTSDYDVGLVGPKSGELAGDFNDKFEEVFAAPSEEIFDTNIYAFSLEYALPSMFDGLTDSFKKALKEMEASNNYKMQDLTSALFKIKKYDSDYYATLFGDLKKYLGTKPVSKVDYLKMFKGWVGLLDTWDQNVEKIKDIDDLRGKHNKVYSGLVAQISDATEKNEFVAGYMTQVMLALMYAAEAYHSRGALRHVVGWTQMQNKEIKDNLTPLDYWDSMLENFGDSMKEYGHCKLDKVKSEVCLVKMSKYMWRTFAAMKEILTILGDKAQGLRDISLAETKTKNWLFKVKKAGKSAIEDANDVNGFFKLFSCPATDKAGNEISKDCMDKIFGIIRTYNHQLIQKLNEEAKNA